MPQNHPRPKEAVSNFSVATVSMGGRLFGVSLTAVVEDCPLPRAIVPGSATVSMVVKIMNRVTLCDLF